MPFPSSREDTKMAKAKQVKVVVTIPNAEGRSFTAVVDRLRDAGLTEPVVHDKLGLVTGTIDADKVNTLKSVEGVGYAREERAIKLVAPKPS
jgi:hypothetical protein